MRPGGWVQWSLGASLVGALFGVMAESFVHPERALSKAHLYVFVEGDCGYSMRILSQLEDDPALRRRVVPLLAKFEEESGLDERVCKLIAVDVKDAAPWYAWFGVSDSWICERLASWSVRVYRDEFVKSPSWAIGSDPVSWRDEPRVLAAHGISLTSSGIVLTRALEDTAGRAAEPETEGGATPSSSTPPEDRAVGRGAPGSGAARGGPSHWRGKDIGL